MTVSSRPALRSVRFFRLALLLSTALFLLGGLLTGQAAPEERTLFPHSLKTMSQAKKATAMTSAAVDTAAVVEFQLTLRMRDFAKLQTRLSKGERISEEEMQARYYPLAADYKAVVAWARAQGLTVLANNEVTRLSIALSGPVATVERALATNYAHVAIDGKDFLAAQTVPSLPARVAAPALGITGLQPYLSYQSHDVVQPLAKDLVAQPNSTTSRDSVPYIPSDIMDAYSALNLKFGANKTLDGTGQTIAILIDTFPLDADLTTFWANTKVPQLIGNVTKIDVNNIGTMLPAPTGQETLDTSWASGIASGAKIRVYATNTLTPTDLDKGLQRIIADQQSGVKINELSISAYGLGESESSPDEIATESQYFATLASRGVSTFVASGDKGSIPNDQGFYEVEYPASDPSVTGVGGTSLLVNIDSHAIASEIAWDSGKAASGGGISEYFQQPAYQSSLDPTEFPSYARLVPDVCLAADPATGAYLILTKKDANGTATQSATQMGGTGWSAPTWAGFCAMINQARELASLPDVGLLNPSIYPLLGTANFRDITGANANSLNYPAEPGYDLITGIGSPVVSQLVKSLTNAGTLTFTEFTPQAGTPGTQVTLSGTQLDQVVRVSFNGTTAPIFQAASGTQLVVTVPNGASSGPITVTDRTGTSVTSATSFTVLPADAGQNDFFADAQLIGPAQTSLTGSNVGATKEAGEPDHAGNPGGASVWYRWSPPTAGTYTINTFGSSFDTLLAVYTGSSVDSLTEVASNDDQATGVTSSVVFNADYGTTYYIAVDGAQQGDGTPAEGTIVLNLSSATDQPVINDFTPQSGAVGQSVRILGANFLGVTSVSFHGVNALFRTDSSTQITAVVPQGATTGSISVTDSAGNTATSAGFFTVVPSPPNDLFANATPINGTQTTLTGDSTGAFKEPGEPNHADNTGGSSVWFVWTAPSTGVFSFDTFGSLFDTLLAVYTGNNVAALTPIASNDDAGSLGTSAVTFNAVAGTVYHIAIDGFNGAAGKYNLNLKTSNGIPTVTTFTPTSGGPGVSVVISGTGFLTATSVKFNGTPAPGFQINSDTQILVTVPNGATTGPITVTGLNGTGISPTNFTVVPAPPNDLFANSQLLQGGAPISVTGTNAGATKEAGEPNIVETDAGGRSIWYTWTPPVSGDFVITTRGSDFDTLLGVYTGSTVAALTPVVTNDDDPEGGTTSAVTLTAIRGVTYRIVVDGSGGEAGNVVLSILNAASVQNLYNTNFEPAEGFSTKSPLVGQGGWLSLNGVSGGNGVTVNQLPNLGQQALIGETPLASGAGELQVYHPLDYTFSKPYPVVDFSTTLKLTGSTNGQNDQFGFTAVDNGAVGDLFSIVFDNATLEVYYRVKGVSGLIDTGVAFSHDVVYSLQVAVDFQNQQFGYGLVTATLNGTPLISGYEGAFDLARGKIPTLTRISADWILANPATPGDNYMVFDQYTVNTPLAAAPVITLQPASQTVTLGSSVTFSVVAQGTPPFFYQWYFEGQPIPGANDATYTIPVVNPSNAGRYYVTVENGVDTTQSLDAFLVVSTSFVPNTQTVQVSAQVSPITQSGGQIGSFLLTRSGDISGALVINYAVHGTAQSGIDYVALDGQATFKAGRGKKRIKVVPIDRGIHDGSSVKVTVKVVAGNGYSVGTDAKAKVFINRP